MTSATKTAIQRNKRIAAYGAVMAEYAARPRDDWKEGETRFIAQDMMQMHHDERYYVAR
ncbi:MAG TPA: hypothetical protein VI837_09220 [Blastocatellia bacterium]|nr:hypothetical protein [Blastocatellia bacterium]